MNLPPSKQLIYLIFSPLIIFPYPFPLIPLGSFLLHLFPQHLQIYSISLHLLKNRIYHKY